MGRSQTKLAKAEPINAALREHQRHTSGWRYQELARELHVWTERFCAEFKLHTPIPAIMVERLARTKLGHFRSARNACGVLYEIALNAQHATQAEKWQVLGTLLHEVLHLWQEIWGQPPRSAAPSYHNVQFRNKAATLALIVDRWGHTRHAPRPSPFFELLERHGVETPSELPPADQLLPTERSHSSKLKLWQCACPVRVRVARRQLRARCLDCGQMFKKVI